MANEQQTQEDLDELAAYEAERDARQGDLTRSLEDRFLTQTERDVLNASDIDDLDPAAIKAVIGDDKGGTADGAGGKTGEDEGKGGEADAPAPTTAPAATPAAAPVAQAPAATPTPAATPSVDDDEPFLPQVQHHARPELDAELTQARAAKIELESKFNEGEIHEKDYYAKRGELEARVEELVAERTTAKAMQELAAQNAAQRWEWESRRFMRNAKAEGVEYGKTDDARSKQMTAELNRQLKALADDPVHAEHDGKWFLEEAHRRVKAIFGVAAPAASPTPAAVKPKGRAPDLSGVPPSIGTAPAAAVNDTGTSEFADLDRLTGMALEKAAARLSATDPDKYNRWLATT